MTIEKLIKLRPGEKIVEIVHNDFVSALPWWIFLFAWMVVPFFFLYPLWQQGWIGVVIFGALVISSFLMAWRTYFSWQRTALIVTDQRLVDIDQHGFFNRLITEVDLNEVEEISFKVKGLVATIFRFGSVLIRTAGERADIFLRHVHQPIKLHHLLNDLMEETKSSTEISRRANRLASLASRLSDEEIERLASAVEKRNEEYGQKAEG
jgi:uncharacterized membrane protein YdbT with pleckstrin-like domain